MHVPSQYGLWAGLPMLIHQVFQGKLNFYVKTPNFKCWYILQVKAKQKSWESNKKKICWLHLDHGSAVYDLCSRLVSFKRFEDSEPSCKINFMPKSYI